MSDPMPTPELGQPLQLRCGVGDAVLAHYQLGHAAAVNTSDVDRIAVYFESGFAALSWTDGIFNNIWEGWKV